ncbi:glycosyltransferase family 2 protein [Hymenobacter arizonensis]|uniref:Glycosyl transferase family 2 n=1 Tax=Hymenobacter arizonensis TaxID=1227077 RepID=A0A1I5YRK3_HYMAR|nr:glycosyltransferase family 2 protein [Hymenobacter arizonensis]SFQ46675.1 Glycosyl transferase family 2 [Hymenobacter arizonensis]
MSALVSIIMPAYNAANFIAESIVSVLAQTYSNWELIVVDDGSTDNTCDIVKGYSIQDPRIKYLYQENSRQGRARNNGIASSTGEYIAFLDSDDVWLPGKLLLQVQEIEKWQVDLVFADSYIFSDAFDPTAIQDYFLPRLRTVPRTFHGEEGLALFLNTNRIPILTVLTKRSAVLSVGGFSENQLVQNAEDYHLWLKMLLSGFTLVGLDCVVAAYRQHSSSVSESDGQNLKQAVEAKVDLMELYPAQKSIIASSIRRTMLLSLEQVGKYKDADYYDTVDRYLYLSRQNVWRLLFAGLKQLGARRLSLKSVYFIFNYL